MNIPDKLLGRISIGLPWDTLRIRPDRLDRS